MKVKILHLYNNLMNLYGEYANISILCRHLNEQGVECEVTKTDSCEEVELSDFDLIYVGSGTEAAQARAAADLIKKKDELLSCAAAGTVMLFTGNSFELLGSKITENDGAVLEGIGLNDFETKVSYKKRYTGDCVCSCKFIEQPFVGFINKGSQTFGITEPLFKMQMGEGNREGDSGEGFRRYNVFGTHLIGPILVKNPHFTKYLIKLIMKDKPEFSYREKIDPCEQGSYEITLRELKKRMGA